MTRFKDTDHKTLVILALVTNVLIWGTAFTLIGYTVKYIEPAWLVAIRTIIAALVLIIYTRLRGHKFPGITDSRWLWYMGMGVIGMTIPFILIAHGQVHVDSGLSSILVGFMPMITIVLAHFFVPAERLTLRKSIGFSVGFLGIVILFLPLPLRFELVENWPSQVLILLAAVCYAVLSVSAKRAPKTSPSLGAAMMLIGGTISAILYAFTADIPTQMPPMGAVIALLVLAIGSTAFAQILYLWLIEATGPSFVAKINYVVPICSLIAGIIFLDEIFSWRSVLAILVIMIGLMIARTPALASRPRP
jgi:drug/metabolite transporter (DMT)-like permease